jgi:hypothetical protein
VHACACACVCVCVCVYIVLKIWFAISSKLPSIYIPIGYVYTCSIFLRYSIYSTLFAVCKMIKWSCMYVHVSTCTGHNSTCMKCMFDLRAFMCTLHLTFKDLPLWPIYIHKGNSKSTTSPQTTNLET